MTDRINAFVVVLERDTRTDDVEATLAAIRQIRNVLSVEPHVAELVDHIAYVRARTNISEALFKSLKEQAP